MLNGIYLDIDWQSLLIGDEDWTFLWEVMLRTIIMTVMIVLALRVLGKRGVKQLSIFELVVIISFGSAAGDPMIYKEIGILAAILVFIVIISVYRLIMYFIGKSKTVENLMEGQPICLIRDGRFSIKNFKKELLGSQELFSELRLKGVSQLGQVETAIEEISGGISVFFYEEDEVKYGLPIMPDDEEKAVQQFDIETYYSCSFCGYTEIKNSTSATVCTHCENKEWIPSSNRKRVN